MASKIPILWPLVLEGAIQSPLDPALETSVDVILAKDHGCKIYRMEDFLENQALSLRFFNEYAIMKEASR